ncbi:GDP-mannose mannosyl hydrolase [Limnobacter sp.]|uniref:GDP-mannose mannosyl hydrolase n=1 Tax=Limnobacter sp. TaxID=2003368 RepID=UPI0035159B86
MQPLPHDQWLGVVQRAPLVSIDLVVSNTKGEVLVGWRTNKPAQHTWFVPGGVVRKGETLQQGFERTVLDELGVNTLLNRTDVFCNVYEHHYPDNFAGQSGFGTHYVVLAHRLTVAQLGVGDLPLQALPKAQHKQYVWMRPAELLIHPDVHANTKAYF